MAKISTYGVVPSPAILTDMVIGTDVSANNETKNFELGQILSLYPSITQKAMLLSTVNQTAAANTPTTVSFNYKDYAFAPTSGLTALPSGGPYTSVTIGNSGFYKIDFIASAYSTVSTQFIAWLKVNALNVGPAHIHNTSGNLYTTVSMSWMQDFSAGDVVSIMWQTNSTNLILSAAAASGQVPLTPSAQIFISQV